MNLKNFTVTRRREVAGVTVTDDMYPCVCATANGPDGGICATCGCGVMTIDEANRYWELRQAGKVR